MLAVLAQLLHEHIADIETRLGVPNDEATGS
jgi:hypothetical protein